MKKIISILLTISMLVTFYSFAMPINALTNTSVEEFAEEMVELYAEEVADGKELEESAACRVIVKATTKPDAYKNAECIIGSNNLYVYQYSDAETAQKAVEYYNESPYVKWAELDGIVESQALPYGNYMLQGDEAKRRVGIRRRVDMPLVRFRRFCDAVVSPNDAVRNRERRKVGVGGFRFRGERRTRDVSEKRVEKGERFRSVGLR